MPSLKNRASVLKLLTITLLAVFLSGGFILASEQVHKIGFPLDDAWIHQTYARNLAWRGEWAFSPGVPSAGSTAPLWSALLAVGYLFSRSIPYVWTFFLGVICLIFTAWIGQAVYERWLGGVQRIPWIGMFLVGEWHLLWASLSGMETGLIIMLSMLIFWLLSQGEVKWFITGLLTGLTVWVRPDGITLIGPALFILMLNPIGVRSKVNQSLRFMAGFLLCFVPYLIFNWFLSGSFWPNTFYSKQAEYAVLLSQPLIKRLADLFALPMVGVGLILLPGFLYSTWKSLRERNWVILGSALWFAGYTAVYALRLPVVYQHGRYLMPVMSVFFILGLVGTARIFQNMNQGKIIVLLRKVWMMSIVGVWLGFYVLGARSYAVDVAIIETEMVETAHWLNQNTGQNALLAVHDIGAVGYYSDRNIVDLAGLVSPEVIPFMRDESKLAYYLHRVNADYLVTFPGWYPELTRNLVPVFESNGSFSPAVGGENMTVYTWK